MTSPFKILRQPFGSLTRVRLINTDTRESVSIVPEFGASIIDLTLLSNGVPARILDGPRSAAELRRASWFKGAKLFPFPGRICAGHYAFGGTEYALRLNSDDGLHAIHGFLYERSFRVKGETTDDESACVTLEYRHRGDTPGYPFRFTARIDVRLSVSNGITLTTRIENRNDRPMPIGDGWHPYFPAPTGVSDFRLTIPAERTVEVDNWGIPTGRFLHPPRKGLQWTRRAPDGVYALPRVQRIVESRLFDRRARRHTTLWQETGTGKYNYVAVFTHPSGRSVAVEPWTCPPNAFRTGVDLIVLRPTKTWEARCGIRTGR